MTASAGAPAPPRDPGAEGMVSVIMPAWNSARWIEESIRSVMAQEHRDWELLVVDDGSSDDTAAIVERLAAADPRIRLIRMERNGGPGPARNRALREARGRFVAFLDSQDLWRPEKLRLQLEFMRERDALFSFTTYGMVDERGERVGRPVRAPGTIDYRGLLKDTRIGMVTVMLDLARIGPVQMPPLPQHEDLVTWYALLKRGLVAHGLDRELSEYRIVRGSASRDKLRSALRMWRVYRVHERLPLADAAWCWTHYALSALRKYRGVSHDPTTSDPPQAVSRGR